MSDIFAQLLKDIEDQNNTFNVDPDILDKEDDMFAKLLRELEQQQIELEEQEEERQVEQDKKKKEAEEAAYIDEENLSFDTVIDSIIQAENELKDPNAVGSINEKDGSKDYGLLQINERWVNKGLTSKGFPSFETNTDSASQFFGQPDMVYREVQDYISSQVPNYNMMSDEFRRNVLLNPDINREVGRIIYENRGLDQWSTADKVRDNLQIKQTSANVDKLAQKAFNGDMPTLDDIASQVNLDPNAMEKQSSTLMRNNPKYKEQALSDNQYVGAYRNLVNSFYKGIASYETTRALMTTELGFDPEERVKYIAQKQAIIKGLKGTKDQEKFFKSETFGEAFKIALLNPLDVVLPLAIESTAQWLPTYLNIAPATVGSSTIAGATAGSFIPGAGTVAGSVAGFTVGNITAAGLAGLSMEYTGKILEIMQEEGVDVTNPDELLDALRNERLMKKARKKGIQKGVPIAIIDGISGGIAGRFIKPALKTGTKTSKALRGTGEVLIQAGLGGTGEIAGSLSAGDEISPPDVLAEAFGEVTQAIPMGALNMWNQGRLDPGQRDLSDLPKADDKAQLKQDIINKGATVTNSFNPQTEKHEVILFSGNKQIQKYDFDTKEEANKVETVMLDKLADIANDKTIKYEGEKPPSIDTDTKDARPWFQKEAEKGREMVKAAEDLEKAVPTSEQITENLEQVYGEEAVTEEAPTKPAIEEKQDYNKMLVKDLKTELKNKGLSRAGKKADLVARLQEADKEVAPVEDVKPVKVFHGESIDGKPTVTESTITPSPEKTLVIEKDQVDIIQDLQKQNVPGAEKFTVNKQGKISNYKAADKFIRDHYKGQYEYIQYNNQQMPTKGTEYHSLKDDKFYSPSKDLANIYAMTGRARKKAAKEVTTVEAPVLKDQDYDTRVNTELTEDENAQVYLDDIRNSKTGKPLAFLNKIKTNNINGFKKAAKELQGYIDENYGSENDQVSENVYQAQKAIDGMEIILQGRDLGFDDNYDIVDFSDEAIAIEEKKLEEAPADTRTQEEIEAENLALMEEMGLTDTDKKTGEAIPPQGLSQVEQDEINDVDDISDIDTKEQQALERLEKNIGVKKFFDNTDPNYKLADKMTDAAVVGAGIIRRGAKSFKQFSSEMVKKIGKGVKPYLKKLYNNAKAYVVEYIKNPKIGASIQVVSDTKPKSKLDPSVLFEPIPVKFYKNKQGKISINTKTLTGKNQPQAAKIYNWMWEFGTNKADFIKAWSKAANEKQRGGLSRRQYEIQVLEKLHPIAKENFIKDVKSRYNKAQDKFGLLQTFESGKHVMDWYDNFYDYMVKNFGDEAGLAIDFIAITSAGVDLHSNIGYGLKAYAQYKLNDELKTGLYPSTIRKNLQNAIDNHKNRNNPNYTPKKIGGMKVTNFSQALRKDENAVVLDLWMAREFGLWQVATPNNVKATKTNPNDPSKDIKGTAVWIYDKKGNGFKATVVGVGKRKAEVEWGGGRGKPKNRKSFSYKEMAVIKDTFTDSEYIQYEQVVKELAEKRGVTPRQMQAGIWFGIREGHSPMHPGQPHLDSAYFEDLLTLRMSGYTNKDGKKIAPWTYKGYNVNQLKELSPDISDALNSFSSFPSPAQMDLIKTMLVDAGRFTYDQLSPAMQKLGNRLGINNNNFKMRFTQYANNARNMTDSSKKWFKKVMNVMKNWFKKMGKKLIDSDPAQKLYKRMEDLAVKKFVSDDEITNILKDTMDKAVKQVKEKGESPLEFTKEEINEIKNTAENEKSDGVISARVGGFGRWFSIISERLKRVDYSLARALRMTYERYKIYVQRDMEKVKPLLEALEKIKKINNDDYMILDYALKNEKTLTVQKILSKYEKKIKINAEDTTKAYRQVLDGLYHKALNMTKEQAETYQKLKTNLPKMRKEVPNKVWTNPTIRKWLDDKGIKYKSKDNKSKLLEHVKKDNNTKKKLESLVEAESEFKRLESGIYIDMGYRPGYFPRNVRDYKGLIKALGLTEDSGEFSVALTKEAERKGIKKEDMPIEMRIKVLSSMAMSGRPAVRGSGFRHAKGRKLTVTKQTNEFYDDPHTALMSYIERIHENIHRKMLFGRGVDIELGVTDDQVGKFVERMVREGKLSEKDQQEVLEVFRARFSYNPLKSKGIQAIKNFTYLTVMGQVATTMIQVGDIILGGAFNSKDPIVFSKALLKAILGNTWITNKAVQSKITVDMAGQQRIAAEFSTNAARFSKALNMAFKLNGFTWIDKITKEVTMNAAIDSMQKLAKKNKLLGRKWYHGSQKYQILIEDAFGEDRAAEIDAKLKNGVIDDDIIGLAYWVLLDHQPVAESEMPENALTSPRAALFYQMKTYTIRQLNTLRNRTFDMARRGHKAQAIRNLMWFTPLLVMAGAGPDALRDWLRGKEVEWEDVVWENILKLSMLSKYSLVKARSDVSSLLGKSIAAFSFPTSVVQDFDYYYKWFNWQKNQDTLNPPGDSPEYGVRSYRHIPIIGDPLYYGYPLIGNEGLRGRKKEIEYIIKKYQKEMREGKELSKRQEAVLRRYYEALGSILDKESRTIVKYMD